MRWLLVSAVWTACAWAQNSPELRAAVEKQRAASALQRDSVRKQAELAGPGRLQRTLVPPWTPPPCEPIAEADVAPLIEEAARAQAVEGKLLHALIQRESGFSPCAVSVHGAQGLMQLMPVTLEQFQVKDPFDPKQSIDAGARYLKQLMDKYHGDLARTLAGYRIGPTAVDQAKGVPDLPEVHSYVDAILQSLATPPAPPQTPKPTPTGN